MVTRVVGIDRFRIDEIRTDLAKNVARKLSHCPAQCDITIDVELRNGKHSFTRCATTRLDGMPAIEIRDDLRQQIIRAIDNAINLELEAVTVDFHGSISVKVELRHDVFEVREIGTKVTWQSR